MSERALSSPLKRRILAYLKENGPSAFKEIKDNVRVSTDSLKLALSDLEADGVVKRGKDKISLTEEGERLAGKNKLTL
ncbi:MAG: hypothetical protein TQ35_0007955 [Candidatus Aramenus sulfurataquae]|jgi:predicted transcriptional regulator|nr:hypothetical protein [Candidatus Aramenus sulfurataquae]